MYNVLSKDMIETEILPHLSTAKRGFETKSCLAEVINSILYKLKTGVQWHMLPVNSLFSDVVLSYKTVYWHFRKWSKNGEWEYSWLHILDNYKAMLDLSTSSIDGSHTRALRGGEEVEFQTRKMSITQLDDGTYNCFRRFAYRYYILLFRLSHRRFFIK